MTDIHDKLKKYKKVGILGLGITGIATYKFFKKHNIEVVVWDDSKANMSSLRKQGSNIEASLQKNISEISAFAGMTSDLLEMTPISNWYDCSHIVVSPGIALTYPKKHPIEELAEQNNIVITSDVEILYDLTKDDAKFVAITGTNGKSTTTSLIGHFLKLSGANCSVGGNIGVCALDLPLDSDIYVLELSSFQLMLLHKFKAHVSVLLNITPDHLDRHGTMENYTKAKTNIFRNQTKDDFAIIGIDNPITAWIYEEEKHKRNSTVIGISSKPTNTKNIICYDEDDYITDNYWRSSVYAGNNIHLQGAHNHENLIAAYAACRALSVDEHSVESHIKSFVGLSHRMQYVGSINKIGFYNDSKATNAEASKPALLALKNIYWLAGGLAKDGGIENILDSITNIKKAYLFGDAAHEFAITLKGKVDFEIFINLSTAFNKAYLEALDSGEKSNILLSPACASYDQYKNFEERGNSFIQLYKNLSKVVGGSS